MLFLLSETQHAMTCPEFCTRNQTCQPTTGSNAQYSRRVRRLTMRRRPWVQSWSIFSLPSSPAAIHKSCGTPTAYGRDVHALFQGSMHGLDGNDGLCHQLLKWHLKCKNILECELVELLEWQQCKKVIAWSRDCRMYQYMSWNLSSQELILETIWGKYEEYCKPQSNEVWARFDLLTSFRQGNCSIDKWYMLCKHKWIWSNTSWKLPKYSMGTFFSSS